MMMDVEVLQSYNGQCGQPAGERLRLKIRRGRFSRGALRSEDVAARYGAKIFGTAAAHTGEEARAIAERIRERFALTEFPFRRVTISLGIGVFGRISDCGRRAPCRPDPALYAAKRRGPRQRHNVTLVRRPDVRNIFIDDQKPDPRSSPTRRPAIYLPAQNLDAMYRTNRRFAARCGSGFVGASELLNKPTTIFSASAESRVRSIFRSATMKIFRHGAKRFPLRIVLSWVHTPFGCELVDLLARNSGSLRNSHSADGHWIDRTGGTVSARWRCL